MKSVTASTLFLLLFNLLALEAARVDVSDFGDFFGRKDYSLSPDGSSKEDETMIRRIEEEMASLNKSDDGFRDKRALGILLQGFMEALGYTVSPIQLASLPNPGPMPAGGAAAMPAAMAPPTGMMMNASASTPPRQRETLRFTGLLNFGNSENTTRLIDHLSRYEQVFHGNRSSAPAAMPPSAPPAAAAAAAAAAADSGPDIDPRSRPPLKEPLFVSIPLPIVPNLPPPQPPSPMPLDHSYHQEVFSKESSEEYSGSKDDAAQHGHFDEEDEESHDSDDFEYKHDKYDNPEDRNYENKETDESYEKPQEKPEEKEYIQSDEQQPRPKESHKEYKSNKNVENFTVENKEIHDPSEVAEEGPKGGSQFDHATFVDEPNWKEQQDAKIYAIAAEQEARAEALAEENAEREKEKERDHEEEAEFHRNREKEIDEANEERDSSYRKKPQDEDDDDDEDAKEEEEGSYDDDDDGGEKEADHEEKGTQRNEARARAPGRVKNYQDADFYPATLPISYARAKPKKDATLRDSYGASLEQPGGKVDERVAEYITMFKNPRSGVYDPKRVRDYEHARISFDHGDLVDGFNRIREEYGAPRNKYEEYEIEAGERAEHRASNAKHEDEESKEILAAHGPKVECSCHNNKKNKIDAEVQGARSTERPVTVSAQVTAQAAGYGPYYSTMKYAYDPSERDHGIIARLTSYEKPTTVKFEEHGPSTIVQPTVPPERPTTLSFLHEAENEEFRAWPAPFDFLYDTSERKNVVYKKSPPPVAMPAPFTSTRPSCNHRMTPFGEHSVDRAAERDSKKRPSASREHAGKAKSSERINKRVEYFPNHSTTQPTVHDQRKRPPSNERIANYRGNVKPTLRSLSLADIITTRPERVRSATKNPRKNRKSPKQFDQTARPAAGNSRESTIKPTVKVKYTYPHGKNRGNEAKEETTNYYEKNGMLVIPEPTPYHYNEELGEFAEEPRANTERIQIKEYRNHVASVEVAELKQLHPEGPMHLFKYTRNL